MREATAMGEEKPTIRWQTYAIAACWAVFGIVTAWVVPPFREMFHDMFWGAVDPPFPLMSRVVVGIPAVAYVMSGLLVAGALVWKLKALSGAVSNVIDVLALVLLLVLVGIAAHGLSAPGWYIPASYR